MKTLILNRHAKSDWGNPELTDFERPLNKRGLRDLTIMSKRLLDRGIIPDNIISSPAKRAITTALAFAYKFGLEPQKEVNIYNSGETYFRQNSQKFDDKYKTIMVFGHNPDFTSLARYFTGEYFGNIPTCGIVCIDFDINSWKDIHNKNGQLRFFDYPKNLDD